MTLSQTAKRSCSRLTEQLTAATRDRQGLPGFASSRCGIRDSASRDGCRWCLRSALPGRARRGSGARQTPERASFGRNPVPSAPSALLSTNQEPSRSTNQAASKEHRVLTDPINQLAAPVINRKSRGVTEHGSVPRQGGRVWVGAGGARLL